MNGVALIPLSWRGYHVTDALVDEDDWPRLAKFHWTTAPVHRRTREFGYPMSSRAGSPIAMHRLIFDLRQGDPESVHHINQVKYDCRRENLQVFPSKNAHAMYAKHGTTHLERIRLGRDLVGEARASLGLPPLRAMPWQEISAIRHRNEQGPRVRTTA